MCGITGAFNVENAFEVVSSSLRIVQERGRDGCGIFDGKSVQHTKTVKALKKSPSKNIVGHVLHSIVHTVSQPIESDGAYLVANCEIYNWEELCKKYSITAENDSVLLLKLLNKVGVKKALNVLRGVYAFCYWNNDDIYLARDIIGIKPLWYSDSNGLVFCSERKGIDRFTSGIVELNPRNILHYSISKNTADFIQRDFFELHKKYDTEEESVKKIARLLKKSVDLRIPDRKFGVLFSGGIDSVIIAKLLKDFGCDFTCYIASTDISNEEVVNAKRIAKDLDLKLKTIIVNEEKIGSYLKKVVPLIEDSNVVKVGVATTLHIACDHAKRDGCKVIFSGSGADELFAGYARYKNQDSLVNLNKDCYSDILKFYEKNSYRDDVVTMHHNLELRVPFLDKELVKSGLNVEPGLKIKQVAWDAYNKKNRLEDGIESKDLINNNPIKKISIKNKTLNKNNNYSNRSINNDSSKKGSIENKNNNYNNKNDGRNNKNEKTLIEKYILRKVAEKLNIPDYIVYRKKKAAQYGSGIDKAITKSTKKNGFSSKSAYLDTFLPKKIMKLGALISGGKDSWYAAYIMKNQNYDISCLISLKSKNKSSYMFHTPNIVLVSVQSEASGIPLISVDTKGEKEKELLDLKKALLKAKKEYGIEGVVSGALYSNYQRERIEKICDELGLKSFSPLWHMDQEKEMRSLLKSGFRFVLSSVGAEGLDRNWIGVPITFKHVDKLVAINKKIGINIAGEGGEFESLVLDCPLFSKRIEIVDFKTVEESENVCFLEVLKTKIVSK